RSNPQSLHPRLPQHLHRHPLGRHPSPPTQAPQTTHQRHPNGRRHRPRQRRNPLRPIRPRQSPISLGPPRPSQRQNQLLAQSRQQLGRRPLRRHHHPPGRHGSPGQRPRR